MQVPIFQINAVVAAGFYEFWHTLRHLTAVYDSVIEGRKLCFVKKDGTKLV